MLIVMKTRQYQNNKSINHHQLIKLKAKIIRVHTIIALMINNRQLNKKIDGVEEKERIRVKEKIGVGKKTKRRKVKAIENEKIGIVKAKAIIIEKSPLIVRAEALENILIH